MFGWPLTDWQTALALAIPLGTGLIWVISLWLDSRFVRANRIDPAELVTKADLDAERAAVEARLSRVEVSIAAIERAVVGTATREDVARLLSAIERADGDRRVLTSTVEGVKELVKALERSVERVERYLMEAGR